MVLPKWFWNKIVEKVLDNKMNSLFYEHLKEIIPEDRILFDEPMKKHTTFRVGGPAKYFVRPKTAEEVSAMLHYFQLIDREYYILGNGSNLLVSDKGYDGVIVEIGQEMDEIRVVGEQLICKGGAPLSKAASCAMKAALTGLEFASGIPGSIGGAVVMNAGAYGGEMKQIVEQATVVAADGSIMVLSNEELEMGYRTSIFKKKPLVCVETVLSLKKGKEEEIRSRMDELREQRIKKQPLEYPSAGSTFKRPEGYFAGKLIMDAGLSGLCIGGAKVSEKHCGFIINTGNASAADIKDLIDEVVEIVEKRFHVRLEPEVCMLGDF